MTSLTDQFGDLAVCGGPRVAFGSWTDAVRRSVLRFRFDCDSPRAFGGTIRNRSLGGVNFVDLESGKHAAYRDSATISEAEPGFYVMTLQLSGELRLAQQDRVAVLKPGLFALYDSAEPAALTVGDGYRSTCVRFPKAWLGPCRPAGITARAFECEPGMRAAVWGMLLSLNRNLETLGPAGPAAVRHVMDLVVTMVRTELAGRAPERHEVLLAEIQEYVEQHLADPALDPRRIAAAHFVSPRQLHVLFEPTGTTVGAWIRERRLDHCRRDLADPLLADVPVAAVAARWGFRGASHFGQVFKRETGRTPAEFRRAARARPPR
ncbi:AraC-like DNA-binding protein [Amycolatopsis bartoniae]|uniref:AraC family transcriptional regulator n=1 Tax=Amycolatopsis bartoniae TaxID=941986 RepID=A0A8H9IZR2_9PSEU|nr:helix-turn-helix domain-containing protein [Amycolatopsis bartoniae]MBB2939017.1 AraC-like DNA-binding protein [Amycolatopsis bartoniae]TVT04272.1 helix-turn-helix domain-containing protein [Amycolatopsis bartoniae]GHF65569.1 AraC family transcriptional regulator [Amycolatopsis bartoniae]